MTSHGPEERNDSTLIIEQCRDGIVEHFGPDLEAVVLAGSFARGEELSIVENGPVRYLSDIEFLLVVKEEAFFKRQNSSFAADLKAVLKQKGRDIDVSLGITSKTILKRFKPYIFTVEVRKFGKVLWGDEDILHFIPAYGEKDISRLDGLILLNNRMVEQLILLTEIENGESFESYHIDKGYVQIVNSLLAFEKRYKCLYDEKKNEIIHLNLSRKDIIDKNRLDVTPCVQAFEHILKRKFFQLSRAEMLEQWRMLRETLKYVWLYEIAQILEYKDLDLEKGLQYILSVPDLISCAQGWAKVLLRNQWRYFQFRDIVTKCFLTSPQFLIYRDAARLYFADSSLPGQREEVVQKWKTIVK